MKKVSVVILTMMIEAGLLWSVSKFIGWDFMEIIFLGGLVIFAIPWLFIYFSTHNQNQFNASVRGMTGQDTGRVKLFEFRFSPIILGLVLFMVLSLCLTVVYYYEYFI
ncbi:hypothetical protein [Sporosarcina koreensis]|uniref:DUF3899 domain-containing protein n=1 Tax=Sporosarcina koreensis TaxID=334735 RepID=A0ABW0TXF2_9BACL